MKPRTKPSAMQFEFVSQEQQNVPASVACVLFGLQDVSRFFLPRKIAS